MCFLTQSVQLTLLCVQLTVLECVEVAKCLEIVEKMNRFALLNFKIFWGQCLQIPILGRGYGAPPQTPPPSALRRFAPPCLARGLRPLHRPSLCVVDILRYFRPWGNFCILAVFERYLSNACTDPHQILFVYGQCLPTCPFPLCGPSAPEGEGQGELTTQKNWGWSRSCCGQLPFLFSSALLNVVQYVGHKHVHILA